MCIIAGVAQVSTDSEDPSHLPDGESGRPRDTSNVKHTAGNNDRNAVCWSDEQVTRNRADELVLIKLDSRSYTDYKSIGKT